MLQLLAGFHLTGVILDVSKLKLVTLEEHVVNSLIMTTPEDAEDSITPSFITRCFPDSKKEDLDEDKVRLYF